MFIHLGKDVCAFHSDIIGAFDLDNASISKHTRRFLADAQKNNLVFNVSESLPRCFVVCFSEGRTKVYITHISSETIKKRASRGFL